jgi:GNAT superfamily N-acetyltransferase
MSSPVVIRKVETKADFKPFFEFPWTLYKDDPNWVPPLLSMRRELFDKQKSPAWEYLEGDFFTAWRGDQIVGTIAAYINHRHNEFHNEHVGWFGAFDVYDDQEAAAALLDTAAEWVKSRGYTAIRGPQTFTTHEECGLLIEGFTRPILLMPYNKPYYQKLVEAAGFTKAMDTFSYHTTRASVIENALYQRLQKLTTAMMKRNKITLRPVDPKNLDADFRLFKELYNAAWDKNWGFVPMTPRELDGMVKSLGQFFDPRLAFFAYVDGDPAGFILGIPDFHQVLARARARPGTPEIITLLRALWHWKIRPVMTWVRVPLMGVKAEYRRKGVDVAMYTYILNTILEIGYTDSDSGWVLETNMDMRGVSDGLGLEAYKRFRFYEKSW